LPVQQRGRILDLKPNHDVEISAQQIRAEELQTMNRSVVAVCVCLLAATALPGCGARTKLTGTWQDPEVQPGTFKKVLVMGLSPNEGRRRAFESKMVEQFEKQNVGAISSSDYMPLDEKLTEENFATYFGDTGVDCILVSRLVGEDKATIYTPGYSYSVPSPYYNDLHGYYDTWWGVASSPGYMTTYDVVKIETNLYSQGKKLIWTGISETFDFRDALDGIESFSKVVVPRLVKNGLFVQSK
jgi:hypothetical protein